MTYTPADVPSFAGLDLRDIEDAQGAIEATDCWVNPSGRLMCRPGYTAAGSVPSPGVGPAIVVSETPTGSLAFHAYAISPSGSVFPSSSLFPVGFTIGTTTPYLVSGHNTAVQLWDSTGVRRAVLSLTSGERWSFAALGGSAWGSNGANTLVQANSSGFAQPTCSTRALSEQVANFTASRAMPKPVFLGVQTPDNRLVAAGFTSATGGPNGTATTPSTIFFSQPDDATKWDETEYEIVGDAGDPIIGLGNWADYLIVFKRREWYVFYGNSVRSDTTGLAVFNYRRVEAGCTVASSVAGARGLYLMDTDGNIRITTGGAPQTIFDGDTSKYTPVTGQAFRAGRFVGFPVTQSTGYLVVDEETNMVFFWALGLRAGATWADQALFPMTTKVATFPNGTEDNQNPITATYASAYASWGQAGVEKSVRQTMFHGTGTITLSWAKDLQSYGYPRSVTMLRGRGIDRNAVRGETLSYKISGTGFTLNRLVPMLREQRPSGVRA